MPNCARGKDLYKFLFCQKTLTAFFIESKLFWDLKSNGQGIKNPLNLSISEEKERFEEDSFKK